MCKKIFFIFFLFLLCKNNIYAQETHAQSFSTGLMLVSKDQRKDEITFSRMLNPIDRGSKYAIWLLGIQIYEIEFNYDKDGDSILIRFYDKQNALASRQWVKLKSEDSHALICDFKPNKPNIDNSKAYQILFGIDYPDKQFITLYQFHAIGGTHAQFMLQDVPDAILSLHKKEVNEYEINMADRARHSAAIALFKTDMKSYKDSIINSISEKEAAGMTKEATLKPDDALQEAFEKKMDNIYINYFKNIHTFNNEAFEVNFLFSCDGNGKIKVDPAKNFNLQTGSQKNWFRDSFIVGIKPLIEKEVFSTLTGTSKNPTLKPDFANWFEKNFTGNANFGPSDRDSFAIVFKNINDELDPFLKRGINVPTIYSYSFKYVSSIKEPSWKYVKENDGVDKFIDKSDKENRVEITENLKQLFKTRYAYSGSGKYDLKISTVSLNDDTFKGQDIQFIKKK